MKRIICSTCQYTLDTPSIKQIVEREQACPVCDEVHVPTISLSELLEDFAYRIADLEDAASSAGFGVFEVKQ